MEINEERVVAALRNAQRVQSHGDAEWERVARSGTLHGAALQSPETDAPVIDRIVEELGGRVLFVPNDELGGFYAFPANDQVLNPLSHRWRALGTGADALGGRFHFPC